jgi:hypothetical protein
MKNSARHSLFTRFAEFCLLQHGEVHIAEIRPVDGIAAAIAKRARGWHGERRRVEPVGFAINGRNSSSIACRPKALGSDFLSAMAIDAQKLGSALNK